MNRQAKAGTPTTIRLPDATAEAVRALAERNGHTFSAEMTRLIEAGLQPAGTIDPSETPEIATMRSAVMAMFEAGAGGLGDLLTPDWPMSQVRVALDTMFAALDLEPATERTLTEAKATKAIADMRPALIAAGLKFKECGR